MTKRIIWRLKEQPTSEMLQGLVSSGILTKDEAREILFNLEEQTDRDLESLKSEIKFLRELVEKLANTQKVVEIIREIENPYRRYPWYSPYYTWTNAYGSGTSSSMASEIIFSDINTF